LVLVLLFRDVNRFWSSRRKLKSSRQIDVDRAVEPEVWDKWCKIRHSRPLLAFNFIIETSFFCTIFLIYFFYIFLITCITVYSLFFEKAVQWTLFTSLFARRRYSMFDKGAPV
jgi:hypothetical protein